MKVLVLGATGHTGALVVDGAEKAGHEVTALVRDPARLSATDGVTVITGDATSESDLAAALAGQDAVISALGASSLSSDLFSSFAAALVPAAHAAGVSRAIVLSNFGARETISQANFAQKLIFATAMKGLLADKSKADTILVSSDLDWTLAYAVTLSNGPAVGITPTTTLRFKGNPKVSRADVADFLVASLTDNSWSRRTAILAG